MGLWEIQDEHTTHQDPGSPKEPFFIDGSFSTQLCMAEGQAIPLASYKSTDSVHSGSITQPHHLLKTVCLNTIILEVMLKREFAHTRAGTYTPKNEMFAEKPMHKS